MWWDERMMRLDKEALAKATNSQRAEGTSTTTRAIDVSGEAAAPASAARPQEGKFAKKATAKQAAPAPVSAQGPGSSPGVAPWWDERATLEKLAMLGHGGKAPKKAAAAKQATTASRGIDLGDVAASQSAEASEPAAAPAAARAAAASGPEPPPGVAPWWDERGIQKRMGIEPTEAPAEAVSQQSRSLPPGFEAEASGSGKAKEGKAKEGKESKGKGKEPKPDKRQKAVVMTKADPNDALAAHYGDAEMVQSVAQTATVWVPVADINAAMDGQAIRLRGRLHAVRGKGKSAFLVVRQRAATIQAAMFADDQTVSKSMVKYASQITRESIVDVGGVVVKVEQPIESCSQKDVEIKVTDLHVISRADALPFEVTDAARSDADVEKALAAGEKLVEVKQDTRLDNRHLDLRTPANQAIFLVQSAVCQLFRESLLSQSFQEIHTPKLIAGASEGGSAVFHLQYMGQPACLAQSPQLYKQMAICSDFGRVFEIGPVFRAERSNTHRHMCEFTGLDLEMEIKEHYFEVLDVLEKLFMHMFDGLNKRYSKELAVIAEQYPFEPLLYKPLRLEFAEGIRLLNEAGVQAEPLEDLNTEQERALGAIVKEKYGTEFFILHRYPLQIRPFYTMPAPDSPDYSNSFDVFLRGEEIISGAQRVHDPALLAERAQFWEIPLPTIQSYIDGFKLGAPPHGGAGVGLERVVMLFCGLNNIRKTSMFPRDPRRLTP